MCELSGKRRCYSHRDVAIVVDPNASMRFDHLPTNEQIIDISQRIVLHWICLQSSNTSHNHKTEFKSNLDTQWFSQTFKDVYMNYNTINEWIIDKGSTTAINNENIMYDLLDLSEFDQKPKLRKRSQRTIKSLDKNISSKQLLQSRLNCEHRLTTIYAKKFGDYTFIVKLLKLLDYIEIDKDEKNNHIDLLNKLILKHEIKKLIEYNTTIDNDILQSKAPLSYHLQKYIFIQSIELLFKLSLFDQNLNRKTIINPEQQPDLDFILKILNFFIKLTTDQ
ncbi:unnamed protein product [Rotaria sp. Silwood1]|nr:unnamed protein product [Rotaria sp. Silwood1]